MMIDSDIITVRDAARLLDCSEGLVRHLERVGRLAAVRTRSGVRLFTVDDVEKLREERAARKRESK